MTSRKPLYAFLGCAIACVLCSQPAQAQTAVNPSTIRVTFSPDHDRVSGYQAVLYDGDDQLIAEVDLGIPLDEDGDGSADVSLDFTQLEFGLYTVRVRAVTGEFQGELAEPIDFVRVPRKPGCSWP